MTWKRICGVADLAENSVQQFDIDGVPILLVRYGNAFRAIPPICPHMEEPLAESGIVTRCILTCTKHLWAWDLRTLEMQGDTEKPLKTYEIKLEDASVFANIDGELTYEFDTEDGPDDDFFS